MKPRRAGVGSPLGGGTRAGWTGARPLDGAGRLARALLAQQPRRAGVALALLLVSAVTETFGIALIIPALYLAGLGGADGAANGVRDAVERVAAALGAELSLPALLAAFVLLVALRSAVAWRRELHVAAMHHAFIDGLRERLYSATADAAWPLLVQRRQSDLLHALTHEVNRAGQGAMLLIRGSVTATFALAQVVLAAAISPLVTAGMALAGGVLLAAARPLVRRSRALGDRLTAGGRAKQAAMAEFLGGLKLAKSEGAEAWHAREFTAAIADMRRGQLAFIRANAGARAIQSVGAAAAIAALVWLALRYAGLGAPDVLVLALIGIRVLPATRHLQQLVQQLAHVLPAWLHAAEMERELRAAAEPPADPAAESVPLRRELTVRGVSFSYGRRGEGRPALAGVDLAIAAHRLVAVTGASGAGKTTLADLLMGLLAPDAGAVEVDGVRLDGGARRRWRRSVACVAQDLHLSHDTIRANLLRAQPEAPEAELWQALRLAAAADFVADLPDGLDTIVGDRGARLSGGERQRIALARALLRRPALLVLDEATGQLDAAAERRVAAALRSMRERTTIVAVTHRPALLAAADHVVVLEAGRVAATGTPREVAPRLAVDEAPTAATPRVAARPWLACVLLALLAGAGHAAQAQTVEDVRSQATVRAGPLYLRPSLRLERLGVETNVFSHPEPQRDFVVSVAPRVDAWLPFQRRALVSTTFTAGADWYAEHAGERSLNPEIRSRIDLPWRRVTLSAGGNWLRTRRRPDFEIDVRSNRFARDVHAGAAVQVLSRLWLDVEARQRVVGFAADAILEGTYLSETLNRRARSAVASLRWRRTALTTFVLAAEVRTVRFFRSPERNNDNLIVTASAQLHSRALVSGSGRIGIRRFRARGTAVEDTSSVVADADLLYRITGNTAATFTAERDISYSFERASPFFVVNRYGLQVTRRLGSALPRLICYRASIVASEFPLPKGGTMSTMSPEGRRELVVAVTERYQRSTPAVRGRILDEFVALTGYHRKHAIRVLNGSSAMPAARRGRRSVYDEAVTEGLVVLWEASDRVCGKRLKALLPTLVPALDRRGHLTLDPRVRERLVAVSAATIDRRRASARAVIGRSAPAPSFRGRPRNGAGFRCARSAIGRIRRRASSRPTWSRTVDRRWPAASSGRWC